MNEQISQPDQSKVVPPASGEDEISLLDLTIVLVKHKMVIIGLPVVAALMAYAASFLMTDIYTATTKILPPRANQSASSALGAQLGGLAGLVSGGSGISGSNDLYIAMLEGRTIGDNMTLRFGLTKTSAPSSSSQISAKSWKARFRTDKGGVIAVSVEDEDPKRAAEIANAYIDELFKVTSGMALTDISQRRLFFERQLALAKDGLDKAEISAREALERRGVASVNNQGMSLVQSASQLRSQITVKEVQVGGMRTFATDRNPELLRAQQEIEVIKRELAKLEGSGGAKTATNGSSGNNLEGIHLLRGLKYAESLYEEMAKQYELAKVDEAKDAPLIQVMDKAVEPEQPTWPNRRQNVLISMTVALILSVLWAFVLEAVKKANGDPRQAERMTAIKRYLAWR